MEQKAHLTNEELEKILAIKSGMNRGRDPGLTYGEGSQKKNSRL